MKTTLLITGMLLCMATSAQQIAKSLTASNGVFIGFYEYKPTDYDPNSTEKYPLMIFLHGIGERGNGTTDLSKVAANGVPKYIKAGHKMRFFWNGKWQIFLVLSPQLSTGYGWWMTFYIAEMVKYAKQNLNIDTNRISLAGLSLGGGGVWDYPGESLANAKTLNAIAPCCPTCQTTTYCNIANANLPVWAFHALDDPQTQANCTASIVQAINNNCNAAVKGYMTTWPTGGHGIWDRAFDTVYNYQNPNVYEWLLGQDKSKPVNKRPVANAGANITISATNGMVNLSGAYSTDADGYIERYIWKKVSGPANGTILTPVSTNGLTKITGLTAAGTYVYQLTVADDRADVTTATVTVTVTSNSVSNIPPVTEAGTDLNTAVSVASLHGSDSYDPDGSVVSYKWTKVAGPSTFLISNDAAANPSVSNLLVGNYQFQLETTDNAGAKTVDIVKVVSSASTLPTTLLYFKGVTNNDHNQLSWATAQEEGNDHFEIESSADGKYFTPVGRVAGAGNSAQQKTYTFTDPQIHIGAWYYRLRMVTINGSTLQYSAIVRIDNKQLSTSLAFFPNPVKDQLTVLVNDKQRGLLHIRLIGMDGRVLLQKQYMKQQDAMTTVVDVSELMRGVYLMEVAVGDALKEVRKVMKE